MRIRKADVGKRCTVEYDDIGRVDAMILDVDLEDHRNQVYIFVHQTIDVIETDQIVEIGYLIYPRKYA